MHLTTILVDCGKPQEAQDLNVILYFADTTYGSVTEYSCNIGYLLMGNNDSICQEDGTWSNDPPKCIIGK